MGHSRGNRSAVAALILLLGVASEGWANPGFATQLGIEKPSAADAVRSAYNQLAKAVASAGDPVFVSEMSSKVSFDLATWLVDYGNASVDGDLHRLSNLHGNLQIAATTLSARQLIDLASRVASAAQTELIQKAISADPYVRGQFYGYLYMILVPIQDHLKRIDDRLGQYLVDHRFEVPDIPALFLFNEGYLTYLPFAGELCESCLVDPNQALDAFLGLDFDRHGGLEVRLWGQLDCMFIEMCVEGFEAQLGCSCSRTVCMPSQDPELLGGATAPSQTYAGQTEEELTCEEDDSSGGEGCSLALPNAGKDFFACNYELVSKVKSARLGEPSSAGIPPCISPESDGPYSAWPGHDGCDPNFSTCPDKWPDMNAGETLDQIYKWMDATMQAGMEYWRDPDFVDGVCADVCDRYGLDPASFADIVTDVLNHVEDGNVGVTPTVSQFLAPDGTVRLGRANYRLVVSTDGIEIRNRRVSLDFDLLGPDSLYDAGKVAAHEIGHLIFGEARAKSPNWEELFDHDGEPGTDQIEAEDANQEAKEEEHEILNDHGLDQQCDPQGDGCNPFLCTALGAAITEIGACVQSGIDTNGSGLGPEITPLPPEIGMSLDCMMAGPKLEECSTNATCADGGEPQPCPSGLCLCSCGGTHDNPEVPEESPPDCSGPNPEAQCLPE